MTAEYAIAVRSMCEFTARSGDLGARFTPAPTAQQGVAGHLLMGTRRGPAYQREVPLEGRYDVLTVRGRADGYDPGRNRLEEFKTHRGDLARMPANQRGLHWAQLKIYGALFCAQRHLDAIDLALVYFDIKTETETELLERFTAAELEGHFATHCRRFLDWAIAQVAHRRRRDEFLTALPFPLLGLRAGQRQMAEAVYRHAMGGRHLMIQAPTGVGKTLGTLFPLLKAAPRLALDAVFFLVAKTSGRRLALDTLAQLGAGESAPLRVLELVSKETACLHPGRACEAASCPLAAGFYDRVGAARARALEHRVLERATLRRVALEHTVCPYYLAQELARWCDVVVGDYNYYFDGSAILYALTQQNRWRVGVLVDEAHNLLPRGRDMYSATLRPEALESALRDAPPQLRRPLLAVRDGWRALHRAQCTAYAVHPEVSPAFIASLQRAAAAIADHLAAEAVPLHEPLLPWYFAARHFCRLAEDFGSHSLFDVTQAGTDSTLCLRNVNPGPHLSPRWAACVTAVLFSATLGPAAYYRQLFGLPETAWLDVGSPFAAHQLEVRVPPRISTRYRDRARSVRPIVDVMAAQYRRQPGNYLAFFSSFDYLLTVLEEFNSRCPGIDTWEQVRGMPAADRDAFVQRFTLSSQGIGFAVLGGAFAEGIDLPGNRLIGAFIATLGLPQLNEVNAEIERRMQELFGSGYEYTYLYPGLQKVVQAAGRVIRTVSDRGCVYLMDDRYTGARVRALLPDWWHVRCD